MQTAAAATARTAAATAADTAGATADTMTTVSINVHGAQSPLLLSCLVLVVPHPILLTPLRALLSLSLVGLVRADGGWGGGGYGSEYGSRDQARRTLANANWS